MRKVMATVMLAFLVSVALAVSGTSPAPRATQPGTQNPVDLQQLKQTDPARYLATQQAMRHSPSEQGQQDANGGPDGNGYIWKDSDESGGPTYSWDNNYTYTGTGDDTYWTFAFGWNFRYRGASYSTCYVNSNGSINFSYGSSNYNEYTFPSTSIDPNCIGPYCWDLYAGASSQGIIRWGTYGSSPNRKVVVTWDSVPRYYQSGWHSFQLILNEADSSIVFQYKSSDAWTSYGYIGIQNASQNVGLNVTRSYLKNSYAIKFGMPAQAAHDVGVSLILAPAGMVDSGATVTPACSVANIGQNTESYSVRMKINNGAYNQTATVSSHPAGTKVYVTFPSWTASPCGTIAVQCSTELSGDGNSGNDKRTGSVSVARPGAFKVLVVAAEAMTSYPYLQNAIRDSSNGNIVAADWFDPRSQVLRRPDSLIAAGYKSILTFTDYSYYNPTAMGDTLAKFMELGGGVVLTVFADGQIAGRYATQYLPIVMSGDYYGSLSMGTIYAPSHPVMQGVSTITSGEYNTNSTSIAHAAYTTRLSDWNSGSRVQAAAYDSAGKRTVFLGFFPVQEIGNYLSGQWVRQIVNALVWTANPTTIDVGVRALVAPGAAVDSGVAVTPACSTYNFGTAAATYKVKMQIGSGYTDSATVTAQASHTATYVTFPSWTPTVRGSQAIACSTRLASDGTPSNDKLTGTTNVGVRDVGVSRLIAPTGAVDSGVAVTPACSVSNWGTAAASCSVRMRVGAGYTRAAYVATLASGARAYVTFPSWTATVRGSNAVRCSTELTADMKTANDKATGTVTVNVPDVGTMVILAPAGSIAEGVVVTPACSVYNYGTTTPATYTVRMKFQTYDQTATVTTHAPGTAVYVTFPTWTSVVGTWPTSCSTELSPDMYMTNDKATGSVTVTTGGGGGGGWATKTPMPAGAKPMKDGGWMAYDAAGSDAGTGRIYASRGNKQPDFFSYNPVNDSWKVLAPWLLGTEGKLPSKGSVGCSDGNGVIYATRATTSRASGSTMRPRMPGPRRKTSRSGCPTSGSRAARASRMRTKARPARRTS